MLRIVMKVYINWTMGQVYISCPGWSYTASHTALTWAVGPAAPVSAKIAVRKHSRSPGL